MNTNTLIYLYLLRSASAAHPRKTTTTTTTTLYLTSLLSSFIPDYINSPRLLDTIPVTQHGNTIKMQAHITAEPQ